MGAAIRITRSDHTAATLRGLAAKSNDGAQVRRLLALALILEGHPRREAAERSGMDRQTLRDWVHRYNEEGDSATPLHPFRGTRHECSGVRFWVNLRSDVRADAAIVAGL